MTNDIIPHFASTVRKINCFSRPLYVSKIHTYSTGVMHNVRAWCDMLYPPLQRSWKRGILVSPCPSARLSVWLWTESCPLCIFYNTHWIHLIFVQFLAFFLNLHLWLCLILTGIRYESIIWIIVGRRGYSQNACVLVAVAVFCCLLLLSIPQCYLTGTVIASMPKSHPDEYG